LKFFKAVDNVTFNRVQARIQIFEVRIAKIEITAIRQPPPPGFVDYRIAAPYPATLKSGNVLIQLN
jgi:hypothetical protein